MPRDNSYEERIALLEKREGQLAVNEERIQKLAESLEQQKVELGAKEAAVLAKKEKDLLDKEHVLSALEHEVKEKERLAVALEQTSLARIKKAEEILSACKIKMDDIDETKRELFQTVGEMEEKNQIKENELKEAEAALNLRLKNADDRIAALRLTASNERIALNNELKSFKEAKDLFIVESDSLVLQQQKFKEAKESFDQDRLRLEARQVELAQRETAFKKEQDAAKSALDERENTLVKREQKASDDLTKALNWNNQIKEREKNIELRERTIKIKEKYIEDFENTQKKTGGK
jgi:uncharacterized protein (DUF3084 family)